MDPLHDLARRALGEAAILDAAKELSAATREELAALLSRGTTLTVFNEDETVELGKVLLTNPKPTWRVVDEAALLAWVEANHPAALVEVRTVTINPAWLKNLLAQGADENGEEPPGIAQVSGHPTLQVRPTAEVKALARSFVQQELEP